jgi:hypothetical protein
MTRALCGTLCFLLLTTAAAAAAQPGNKDGTGSQASPRPRAVRSTTVQFSVDHVRAMREHYAARYRQLPPGLHRKYMRSGQLPPGWQTKMEPLPVTIDRKLPTLPVGYRRGVIDGHAVIYNQRAGTIVDVAVLF